MCSNSSLRYAFDHCRDSSYNEPDRDEREYSGYLDEAEEEEEEDEEPEDENGCQAGGSADVNHDNVDDDLVETLCGEETFHQKLQVGRMGETAPTRKESGASRHFQRVCHSPPLTGQTIRNVNSNERHVTAPHPLLHTQSEADLLVPVAPETKIRNLREQAEQRLGRPLFQKVYTYLKNARSDSTTKAGVWTCTRTNCW